MKQVKILVNAKLAEAFKNACIASGITMAGDLSHYMEKRVGYLQHDVQKNTNRLINRGGRRKEVVLIIAHLKQILDAEQLYQSRIPENLQSGPAYESSEQSIETLEQVIEQLRDAY
jgi:vacuolar-type H+-ATPase subunit I/STV1